MICPNCKNDIPDSSKFCSVYGTPISYNQPIQPQYQKQMLQPYPQQMPPQSMNSNSNKTLIFSIIVVACFVICGLLLFIFIGNSDSKNANDKEKETTGNVVIGLDDNQYNWLSEREITAADLSGKSACDLRLMRNAIFAKRGYKFKSDDLKEYFSNFSWYTPTHSDVTPYLSNIEKKNIEFIKKFDGRRSTTAVAPKRTGSLSNISFTGDYSDIVCYTLLNDSNVAELSSAELRILRNTIYARHGLKFKSADLRNYFNSLSWYNPRFDDISDNSLSYIERHNIMLFKKYE